jgi:hypothetical protein
MQNLKFIILLSIISFIGINAHAQNANDVVNKNIPVTFFGIDFTKSKGVLLGARSSEMIQKYFPAINNLMIEESNKYDIAKAFNKSQVEYDFNEVNKLNALIDTNNFQVNSTNLVQTISRDTIANMIKQYNLKGKTGTGLVFIVQSLDKSKYLITFHFVFFTMPEAQIIIDEIITGKPMGFGMRNYWANSFHDALKHTIPYILQKKYYNK